MNTYFKTIFILGVAAWLSCCNMGEKDNAEYCDDIMHVTLFASLRDSIMSSPYSTMNLLKKMRENTNDSISSYSLLLQISICYIWAGERDSAMMMQQKVLDYCKRAEPAPCLLQLQLEAYLGYAVRLAEIEEYDSAIVYFDKSLYAMMKSGDRHRITNIYTGLAICYHRKSAYSQASYYYQRYCFEFRSS